VEASRPDAVRVEVAASVVEISDGERDRLLRKLRIVGGFDSIIAEFESTDSSALIELNLVERFRLRSAIQAWRHGSDLPTGIAGLLATLEQADRRSHAG
jgi:hypothetical protein